MKSITILVPDGQVNMGTIATIVGALEIFTEANAHWTRMGRKSLYTVQTAGLSDQVVFAKGSITLKPDQVISHIKKTDLIIVPPSAIRSPKDMAAGNTKMASWIAKQYKQGAEVASMCSGIFMLASTGILDGRACSAHWAHAGMFRAAFPEIQLQEDKLILHESGIYTNGGAYSFLNLALFIIEKYYDKATAVYCAKMFQIEIDRHSQSQFAIFTGQKKHHDELVLKAQMFLEENYQKKISVEMLCQHLGAGRRSFDRRFIKATGITPLDYLQRVKIEVAKTALEKTRKTVNEVMYDVGYQDAKAFREVFGRVTGLSPMDYKLKYNHDHLARELENH